MSRLEETRRQFEGTWHDLRQSLVTEFGREPRWRQGWFLPVFGFAAGLALAYLIRTRDRQEGRQEIGRARR